MYTSAEKGLIIQILNHLRGTDEKEFQSKILINSIYSRYP